MGNRGFLGFVVASVLCVGALGASSKRWINSADCVELCGHIEVSAEKAKRPELTRLLCHVAACEVGKLCGEKEIRSPNGLFHGPFQFTRQTWKTVCQPLFKKQAIAGCSGKKSIYDVSCSTTCASQLIAEKINGGIRNWPQCGPVAKRAVASEKAPRK
jgi:hypothetical protein